MQNKRIKLLTKLAKSWNQLDISFIETELQHEAVYESQWVLSPLVGKSKIITHLKTKFNAIRAKVLKGDMTISAKLANHPNLSNEEIIILTQTTKRNIIQVTIRISIVTNKINRIDVCFIPDPALAEIIQLNK